MSSDTTPPPLPSDDPYAYLGLVLNPDGTVTRGSFPVPRIPAMPDPSVSSPVISKDFPINDSKNTWLRLYLPRRALDLDSAPRTIPSEGNSPAAKLPLLIHYHGGGFVVCSADMNPFHDFCTTLAVEMGTAVASVEYRLAPEHRLPAAYEDSVEALHWIKTSQEDWFIGSLDLSNCFLVGDSAGGNIAYNAGLRAATEDLSPLNIRGLILYHPFFGGSKRTQSEIVGVNDKILPLCVTDLLWELALPLGVDRDHEYCNPTAGAGSELCDRIRAVGWKVLLVACDGDPLFDHQMEFAKMLEEKGVRMTSHFSKGGQHGKELMESNGEPLVAIIKEFLLSSVIVG